MSELMAWARSSPIEAALLALTIGGSLVSTSCSVVLAALRRAYPEPEERLPRWLRFLEGLLDGIAINTRRTRTPDQALEDLKGKRP